jgi:hypothetical protein
MNTVTEVFLRDRPTEFSGIRFVMARFIGGSQKVPMEISSLSATRCRVALKTINPVKPFQDLQVVKRTYQAFKSKHGVLKAKILSAKPSIISI